MKNVLRILLVLCFAFAATAVVAQDVTTGSIGGTVVDANGGAIPGAKVTVTGPTGEKSVVTNEQGGFEGRVVHHVEDCRDQGQPAVHAEQHRDEPQMADGRVSENPLEVALEERCSGAQKQRAQPDPA